MIYPNGFARVFLHGLDLNESVFFFDMKRVIIVSQYPSLCESCLPELPEHATSKVVFLCEFIIHMLRLFEIYSSPDHMGDAMQRAEVQLYGLLYVTHFHSLPIPTTRQNLG